MLFPTRSTASPKVASRTHQTAEVYQLIVRSPRRGGARVKRARPLPSRASVVASAQVTAVASTHDLFLGLNPKSSLDCFFLASRQSNSSWPLVQR